MPEPEVRRRVSDRLLIALLAAVVGLVETWHSIAPAQGADAILVQRIERLEMDVGHLREAIGRLEGRMERR